MCKGNCKNCKGNCGRCKGNKEESTMLKLTKTEFADIFGDLSRMLLLEEVISTLQLPIMLGAVDGEEFIKILIRLHENFAKDCKEVLEGHELSIDQTVQELICEVKVVNGETDAPNKVLSKDNFCEIIHKLSCTSLITSILDSLAIVGSIDVDGALEVLEDIHHDLQDDVFHTVVDRYGIDIDDITVGDFLERIEVTE